MGEVKLFHSKFIQDQLFYVDFLILSKYNQIMYNNKLYINYKIYQIIAMYNWIHFDNISQVLHCFETIKSNAILLLSFICLFLLFVHKEIVFFTYFILVQNLRNHTWFVWLYSKPYGSGVISDLPSGKPRDVMKRSSCGTITHAAGDLDVAHSSLGIICSSVLWHIVDLSLR